MLMKAIFASCRRPIRKISPRKKRLGDPNTRLGDANYWATLKHQA